MFAPFKDGVGRDRLPLMSLDVLMERLYATPPGVPHDTPLYALYRIYEHLVLNRSLSLRNEFEYFWFARWPLASIPDPEDYACPERYAVLACIPHLLLEAFNRRIELGLPRHAEAIMTREEMDEYQGAERVYEMAPEWTGRVPACGEVLVIPHEDGEVLEGFADERASWQLREKNILCWQPHIHFI
ncbi:hypothetical protein MMC30_006949 [Trapelia coarctata]|nr:hypothetical protein [Trapelia coarctata]